MLREQDASGFVLLGEAVPEVILEMRYYSIYNFVGARIDGYEERAAQRLFMSERTAWRMHARALCAFWRAYGESAGADRKGDPQ